MQLLTNGEDLSLFTTETLAGRTFHIMNPEVKKRYFPSVAFNPSTSPDYFEVPKPQGTYRIFCLGGSTTVGYPYWYNGSFSSYLRDRLLKIFPDRNIEIINVGMTATNSFTVNDMARELVKYEPDLFVVYDGHNEFYGALGVASHESIARSRWLTKAYLRLIHFRTFRYLQEAITSAVALFKRNSEQAAGSTMMEKLARGQYIPYGSDLYHDGLVTYKENLEELASIASDANVPVLLGSQVSNLRDLPPFISEDPASNAGRTGHSAFQSAFERGQQYWVIGKIDLALEAFVSASAIDTMRADAKYEIARCLDSLGRESEANAEYIKARDYDMLRFRMSSDFNSAMKEACERYKMLFVDMEQAFRSYSTDSIIDKELIVEHLHPNSQGYFLLAKEYARVIRQQGLFAPSEEWSTRDTISDDEFWMNKSVTELDELIARRRTEILTSGWPFKEQTPTVSDVANDDTLGQIAERVTRAEWNWKQAHEAAAEFYLGRKEWGNAKREYLTLINQLPMINVQPYLKLARLYLNDGDLPNARAQLLASLNVSTTILAYRALGDISLQQKKPREAIPFYEKTLAFSTSPQERIENGYLLALACAQSGLKERATAALLQILSLKPDFQQGVELLTQLNEKK